MQMNTTFSLKRVRLLLKWDAANIEKRHMQLLVLWPILILFFIVAQFESDAPSYWLLIFGFLFSESRFSFFGKEEALRADYLLIPASNEEKIASVLFGTTIYYLSAIFITYLIGTIICGFFKPINWDFISSKGILEQYGGVTFKNYNFWSISVKIILIQTFNLFYQITKKQKSVKHFILTFIPMVIVFLMIFPIPPKHIKLLTESSWFNFPISTTHVLQITDFFHNPNIYISILLSAIMWFEIYSLLSKKQLHQ